MKIRPNKTSLRNQQNQLSISRATDWSGNVGADKPKG
jgi:hypothetical protein